MIFVASRSFVTTVRALPASVKPGSRRASTFSRRQPWRSRVIPSALAFGLGWITVSLSQWCTDTDDHLSETAFTPFILADRCHVSPSSSILDLVPVSTSISIQDLWKKCHGSIWSVQVKQPQLQIVRSYTPLPGLGDHSLNSDSSLRFLIRHWPQGEVSNYLNRLPIGDIVDIRGPFVEAEIPPSIEHVIFLAGGTGIAPALQLAQSLLPSHEERHGDSARRRMTILWANRQIDDCAGGQPERSPAASSWSTWLGLKSTTRLEASAQQAKTAIVEELENISRRTGGRLAVKYFIDAHKEVISRDAVLPLVRTHTNTSQQHSRADGFLVVVSGPDGFVNHLAGAKAWNNGKETQGPLGGILKEIGLESSQVLKL